MSLVSSSSNSNNHNLYFSKNELSKILNLYSKGVSRGEWKDYAIDFNKDEAIFSIYKHSLATPDFKLSKFKVNKKKQILYGLSFSNKKTKYENIDSMISSLYRKNLLIIL